jgi:hypothetical protein
MRRWEALQKRQQEVEAARARKAQAEAEAKYAQMVSAAMRYADEGHNRDVLFGVLLGRDCDAGMAQRIADSVWALQQARRAAQASEAAEAGEAAAVNATTSSDPSDAETASQAHQPTSAKQEKSAHEARTGGLFDSLWQGFFGVRS